MGQRSGRISDTPAPGRPGPGATLFFERQARARRLAVVMIAAFLLWIPALLVGEFQLVAAFQPRREVSGGGLSISVPVYRGSRTVTRLIWAGSAMLIALIGYRRWAQFAGSGTYVAIRLGARMIAASTARPEESRLLHVVEEIAIAAGVPTPSTFLLDGEAGINAFAAGTRQDRAAIVVTRGALVYLTRDELQGLIAHEMSHIVHRDMRLNLWMTGVIAGMLAIYAWAGRAARALGTAWYTPPDRSPWLDRLIGCAPPFSLFFMWPLLPLMWLDMMLVRGAVLAGAVGVFTARCLQALTNRQREELADASAVQFTRYPGGLAGVLKKIGGLPEGSAIGHELAPLMSHMCFESPVARDTLPIGTHPPLLARIRKLDPHFSGGFARPVPLVQEADDLYRLGQAALNDPSAPEPIAAYRRRAEALIAEGRRLKARYQATGDTAIRERLRRLEAIRRDLWIDVGRTARDAATTPADALSEGVVGRVQPAKWLRPAQLRRLLDAPEGMRLTVAGWLWTRLLIPACLVFCVLLLPPLAVLQYQPARIDPRLVGAWRSSGGETTYVLRGDGTFSYRPRTGIDEPAEGRWWVKEVKGMPNYAIPREPLTLTLRADDGWTITVSFLQLTGADEMTTMLPTSIAHPGPLWHGYFTYHRTK